MQPNTSFRRVSEDVTAATKTLDQGDSGVVQRITVDSVITFPATVVGRVYTLVAAVDGVDITLRPQAADKFIGGGLTAADDKDVLYTNARVGDEIQVVGDGVDGYHIVYATGTITREA